MATLLSSPVTAVVFSPDGQYLLTGTDGGTVCLQNVATGDSIRTYTRQYAYSVNALAFSADGQFITAGYTGCVNVWNTATGELQHSFQQYYGAASVDFSPDGKKVIAGCEKGIIRLWDRETGECVDSIEGCLNKYLNAVAISPDGKQLCTAPGQDYAVLWNLQNGERIGHLKGALYSLNALAYSPDGRYLLGSGGRTVFILDGATGDSIRSWAIYPTQLESVAWSPDGKQILTGTSVWERDALLWDAESGDSIRSFNGHTGDVVSVAFSPDGKQVLTGSWSDDNVYLWNIDDVSLPVAAKPASVAVPCSALRFIGNTTLALTVSGLQPFPATLCLYQPSGRLVASVTIDKIQNRTVPVGLQYPVAAGVYFYRLRDNRSGADVAKGGLLCGGFR
jgi:WD40 repeat protein